MKIPILVKRNVVPLSCCSEIFQFRDTEALKRKPFYMCYTGRQSYRFKKITIVKRMSLYCCYAIGHSIDRKCRWDEYKLGLFFVKQTVVG